MAPGAPQAILYHQIRIKTCNKDTRAGDAVGILFSRYQGGRWFGAGLWELDEKQTRLIFCYLVTHLVLFFLDFHRGSSSWKMHTDFFSEVVFLSSSNDPCVAYK